MLRPSGYLDECVNRRLAPALQERGFSVTTAHDVGMRRASDEEQLVYASRQDRVVLTHNGRNFRRLHLAFQQQGQTHGGIIDMPAMSPLPELTVRAAMMLDWLGTMPDYRSGFFRWGRSPVPAHPGLPAARLH